MRTTSENYAIPPLADGGLMLTYRCNNACKHCIYKCSPKMPDEWITLEMAERLFDALLREPRFTGLHIAGGEATINMDLLVQVIELAREKGVPLDYLETNAHWCESHDDTVRDFRRMKKAGLDCVMISASMYHNEFIPFRNTKTAVAAAQSVFGDRGFFVYPAHLYQILDQLPDDGRHRLDSFCEALGIEPESDDLHRLFPLIPNGRPLEALSQFFPKQPVESFRDDRCANQLQRPHHVHLDLYGNLFTGSCCGVSPGTVDNLHPQISLESTPIFFTLCDSGPHGLLTLAEDHGFQPDSTGYRGKCDLCLQIRTHLHATNAFAELKPRCFYEN